MVKGKELQNLNKSLISFLRGIPFAHATPPIVLTLDAHDQTILRQLSHLIVYA